MGAHKGGFSFPTSIVHGPGALGELPAHLRQWGCKRMLVVSDKGIVRTRAFGLLGEALGVASRSSWELFDAIAPNPTEQDVASAAEACRQFGPDVVIAFGGGSVLDVGKALRLLIKQPDLQLKDFDYRADWSGLMPFIAIPTTAGTGSEVGRSSVITLAGTHRKSVLFQPNLLAKLVILDPEVTRDLPPVLTAATGLDALTHCIESFTSPAYHPLCDGVALEGIRMIVEALPRAVLNGGDMESRATMLVAASMGGVAFQKDLGAAHSLAHPLSALAGMHHGTANAVCLPHVMRFNAERTPGVYRRVGVACGLDVATASHQAADGATIDFVARFITSLNIKPSLRDYGVSAAQLDALAEQAFADSCHLTNPVPVSRDDLKKLYETAL